MRRLLLVFIFILLAATFVRGWQSSPGVSLAAGCSDVQATPDYLASNSEQDAVAAINNARAGEGLGPLHLPVDFYRLDPARQQFVLINLERTDRGLPPVRLDATLSRIAQNYSRQMRDLQFFAHTSPIAGSFSERVESNPALSGHYALAAENLAGNPVPGAGAMYEYMYDDGSEACGHRANILDPNLTQVGIGWVPGSIYGSISAQEFIGSAPWDPYQGTLAAPQTPQVSIVLRTCAESCTRTCRDRGRSGADAGALCLSSSQPDSSCPDEANVSSCTEDRRKAPTHPLIHPLSLQEEAGMRGWTSYRVDGLAPKLASFYAQVQPNAGNVRITWFLDRVGNLPFSGADISLNLHALAPGKHTLLVYAVNGEQNYAMASFVLEV